MPFSAKSEEKIQRIKTAVSSEVVTEGVLSCCAIAGFRRFPYDNVHSQFVGATETQKVEGVRRAVDFLETRLKGQNNGQSMVMITLNSQQKVTAKALKKLGYTCTGWAKRPASYGEYATRAAVFVKQLYGVEEEKV